MEKPRNRYILLQDGRSGENLWSVHLCATPTHMPKGALLEELRETEQPGDSTRIAVQVIYRTRASSSKCTGIRFECRREDIAPLTREEADLLLAIAPGTLRYQIYIDRGRLDFGKRIQGGSHVMVSVKGIGSSKNLAGVVRYKGFLPNMHATMFGVQLHVS